MVTIASHKHRTFPDAVDVPEVRTRFPELGILDTARTQRWLRKRGHQARRLPKDLEHPVLALFDALDLSGDGLIELQLLHATLLVLSDDLLSGELHQQGHDMRQILWELTTDVEHLMGIAQHVQRDAFVRLLLPLAARHPDFLEVLPFRAAAQTAIRQGELRRVFLGNMEADSNSKMSELDSQMSPMRRSRPNFLQRELRRRDTMNVQLSSVVKSGSSPSLPLVNEKPKSVALGPLRPGKHALKAGMEGSQVKLIPSALRRQSSMPAIGGGLTAGWTAQLKKTKAYGTIRVPDAAR